jgi:tol-pal system protein YbgF
MVAFPDSGLSDNAQYWLAETHYVSQDYGKSLPEFTTVIKEYPDSRKIPDALLKIGYCNYELQRWDAARQALTSVVRDYPETTAARLANQRLERMASEGH